MEKGRIEMSIDRYACMNASRNYDYSWGNHKYDLSVKMFSVLIARMEIAAATYQDYVSNTIPYIINSRYYKQIVKMSVKKIDTCHFERACQQKIKDEAGVNIVLSTMDKSVKAMASSVAKMEAELRATLLPVCKSDLELKVRIMTSYNLARIAEGVAIITLECGLLPFDIQEETYKKVVNVVCEELQARYRNKSSVMSGVKGATVRAIQHPSPFYSHEFYQLMRHKNDMVPSNNVAMLENIGEAILSLEERKAISGNKNLEELSEEIIMKSLDANFIGNMEYQGMIESGEMDDAIELLNTVAPIRDKVHIVKQEEMILARDLIDGQSREYIFSKICDGENIKEVEVKRLSLIYEILICNRTKRRGTAMKYEKELYATYGVTRSEAKQQLEDLQNLDSVHKKYEKKEQSKRKRDINQMWAQFENNKKKQGPDKDICQSVEAPHEDWNDKLQQLQNKYV